MKQTIQNFIIKNALLCDHRGQHYADIEIQEGKITQIAPNLQGHYILDATSQILMPSCIDLNIQTQDYTQKDFQILEQKAIEGGVGTIVLPTLPEHLELFNFFNTQSHITFIPSAIPYLHNKIQEISRLYHDGSKSISLHTLIPNDALECIYQYAQMHSLPCTCAFQTQATNIQSEISYQMGLSGIAEYIEEMELSRIIPLIQSTKTLTLFQALSNFSLFKMIQNHPLIRSEVSIHHLILHEEKILGYNTWAKLNPPLTPKKTQEKFLKEVAKLDTLTSLHREFSQNSKEQTFEDASFGVDCLHFYFPLLFTELVQSKILTLEELSAKTSFNQAQFLKLNQGEIRVGQDANLILFHPQETQLLSHPLYGERKLFGKIKAISSKSGLLRL